MLCCKLTRMYRNFSSLVDLTSVLCTKGKKSETSLFSIFIFTERAAWAMWLIQNACKVQINNLQFPNLSMNYCI
jgi:hypothetical protein